MVVFLVVALASTGVLAWLTLQLLAQDRAADQQRQRERLEQVADSATSDVARRLASLERHLDAATSGIDPLPAGTMVVSWDATGLKVSPGGLLYRPTTPSSPSLVSDKLVEAYRTWQLALRDWHHLASPHQPC